MSQIGANNCTAGQVQSEVEFAPAAAYSLGFMLLREPFSFAEDLEAGTVHHQMDRHRPGLPHRLSDAQAVCATRQCGVIRYPYIQPHERADGSHKSLRLSQPQPIRRAQRQACLDRQIRVSPLATPRRAARRAPHTLSLITDPDRQVTPLAQALVIFCPVDHPVLRLIKLVPSRCVELMWHPGYPLC